MGAISSAVADSLSGISSSDVQVTLSQGSVAAEIIVTPPEGVQVVDVAGDMTNAQGTIASDMATNIQNVPDIANVAADVKSIGASVTESAAIQANNATEATSNGC